MWGLLSFSFILLSLCDGAKILTVFTVPTISADTVYRPLINELLKKGHEIVLLTTDVESNRNDTKNLREIDLSDILYEVLKKRYPELKIGHGISIHNQQDVLDEILNEQGDLILRNDKVKTILNSEKFDLIIMESAHNILLPLSHVFNAPIIQMSSISALINFDIVGAPVQPLFYPEITTQTIQNHNVMEQAKELIAYALYRHQKDYYNRKFDDILTQTLPNVPKLEELKNNVDLLFLNTNPIWEENRPVPTGVCYTMGIEAKFENELPEDLHKYINSSRNGVIYVDFGSNIELSTLPEERVKTFINALSMLPYEVLLKWDQGELPVKPKNVRPGKWFPRTDVLNHRNVKLYISQADIHSIDAAIYAGIPLLSIPLMYDQWVNAIKIERHNIGKAIEIETATEKEYVEAIETIINNDSYYENILDLNSQIYDQRSSSLERATWWVDYVTKHGTSHLRSPSAGISLVEYIELDLLLIIFSSILLLTLTIIGSIVFVIRRFFVKSTSTDYECIVRYEGRKFY